MGGEKAAGVDEDTLLGPGVEDLLPVEGPPILYDCDIAVRAKKDVAAANMLELRWVVHRKCTAPW